jgi:hypothetical protein
MSEEKKHSKMTLMSEQEALEYAASPQGEPRIGSEDNLTRLFQDILREGQGDRRPGDDWTPSVFLRMEDN